jgi:hypothetical protein
MFLLVLYEIFHCFSLCLTSYKEFLTFGSINATYAAIPAKNKDRDLGVAKSGLIW